MPRDGLDPDALPIVLRQSLGAKLKALLVGAWYAFMTGIGVFILVGDGVAPDGFTRAIGAGIAVLGGPLALYWLLQLVPGSSRLLVARDGVHVRHCFVSRHRRWEELERCYTRTFRAHRIPNWTGVAFARADRRPAGIGTWLEGLRVRGIFDTDLLPDTYGVSAEELCSFLNACDARWSGEKLGATPDEIPATRGFYALTAAALLAFMAILAVMAAAAASEGNWGGAAFAVLLASPFAYALTRMVRKRRGFTIPSQWR